MPPTHQPASRKPNASITLGIILVFAFLGHSLSLQRYCTSDHYVKKGTDWSRRQAAKLDEYMENYFTRSHPSQITGYTLLAYGRRTACLNVYIGADRQLQGAPPSHLEGNHNEI